METYAFFSTQVWHYLCVPQSCKDTLQEMLDISLLKDPSFLLVCLGNVLAFLGFYVPFVYSVDLAYSRGVDKSRAAFLISVIGQCVFVHDVGSVSEW